MCAQKWFVHSGTKCPVCAQPVGRSLWPITFAEKVRLPIISNPQDFTEDLIEPMKIVIQGSYGTKIDMIIKHILYILGQDVTSKFLIFSQWDSVLAILTDGMKANKIGHLRLEGTGWASEKKMHVAPSEVVSVFESNFDICCLLLNSRSQSAGLTLNAASHVFLIEPLLDLGMEAQAIHRVHRIGQKKKTHVWRYSVEGTIEGQIQQNAKLHTIMSKKEQGCSFENSLAMFGIKYPLI